MGKGVALNENTYQKMSRNGLVAWECPVEDKTWRYTAEYDRLTVQLVENDRATHYDVLKVIKEPYETLKRYHAERKALPPLPKHEDFQRAWKKQVKRKFNHSGWLRR